MSSRYRHRRTSSAGTSFPSPVEPGEIVVNTANRQLVVGDAAGGTLGAPLTLLAVRPFDARGQYVAGDFVVNGGKLYCAKGAVTPGAFNATQWDLFSSDATLNVPSKSYIDTGDATVTTAFQTADATLTTNYQAADTALQTSINGKVAKAGDTMTGPLALPAGSAGVPALNFGTGNTGLYGGATVRITTTGVTRLTIADTNVTAAVPVVLPANPTNPLEAATKQYVDTQDGLAPTKTYIDTQDALKVAKAGDTMTGPLVLPADPTTNLQAATKQYVDNKPSGGTSLLIADTPPAGAPDGSLWWESDTGLIYLKYNDGNSTQWVIACPQPDLTTFALKTDLTSYVAKAGDTMTGNLTISAANPVLTMNKAASGGQNALSGYKGGTLPRWQMLFGDSTPESGSNAGSDFQIAGFKDDGSYLNSPLFIARATGLGVVAGDPTAALGIATKQYVDNHASPPPVAATWNEYISNTPAGQAKMLTPGAIWAAGNQFQLTDAATVTPDFSLGLDFQWTIGGVGRSLANPLNAKPGQKGLIIVRQDASGSRTITGWGSAYWFSGGVKPTLSTTGFAFDTISYFVLSSSIIFCTFNAGFG